MNKKQSCWLISAKKADFYKLAEEFNIDPVTARIIRNRDIIETEDFYKYINAKLDDIPNPALLKDMDRAVEIIISAIKDKKHIRIVGDYDTDGTCATFILLKGINSIEKVADYYIPDRIADGYGINKEIIKQSKLDSVDLIITCDNGIAAIEELEYADELGIEVIVTDHHQLVKTKNAYIMPKALAVVNPHRFDCAYKFKNICGANIAFKLIRRLYELYEIEKKDVIEELELFAAVATVGDLMPLIDENRILLKHSLENFNNCRNLGLRILCEELNIDIQKLKAYDIGFKISPCINAGGRLNTARLVLELFSAENTETAKTIAKELIELNEKRKEMTAQETRKAVEIIDGLDESLKILTVYLPDCHESIAGIVASRVKDRYNRPTLIITDSKEGLKGSARSIESYSMYEEMSKCREIFTHFGGHKMAAGFSLPKNRLEELRHRLNENCNLSDKDIVDNIVLDMELPLDYLTVDLIKEFELLEPFGMGNRKPVFGLKAVQISSIRKIGKEGQFLKIMLKSKKGRSFTALCFDLAEDLLGSLMEKYSADSFENLLQIIFEKEVRISVTYYPSINYYMGNESIQIDINGFRL